MSELKKGSTLKLKNTYIIEDQIGDGGFGSVYKGKDKKTGKVVAIKLFKSEAFSTAAEARMYWEREYKLTERVNDYPGPHMEFIEAYEDKSDRSNPKFYIVLGFIENAKTLKKWFNDNLRKTGGDQLSIEDMIRYIFVPLADFMYYAQQKGNIHRDFTFNNIMVVEEPGKPPTPIVIDWGGGREFDPATLNDEPPKIEDLPGQGTVIITPGFFAPEVIMQKPPLPQTDIYMFGAVLFYALTNGYTRVKPTVASDYILHPQDYNMNIDETLSEIVEKCTQYEPRDRFRHFGQVKEALERYLAGEKSGLNALPEVGGDQFVLHILNNNAIIHLKPEEMVLEEGKNIRIGREIMVESAPWDESYRGVFRGVTRCRNKDKPRPREQFFLGYSKTQNIFYIHEGRNTNPTLLDGHRLPPNQWVPIRIGQVVSVENTTVRGVFELISILDKEND